MTSTDDNYDIAVYIGDQDGFISRRAFLYIVLGLIDEIPVLVPGVALLIVPVDAIRVVDSIFN